MAVAPIADCVPPPGGSRLAVCSAAVMVVLWRSPQVRCPALVPRLGMTAPPDLEDPDVWSALVEAVQPASMLLAIHWRMGDALRQQLSADDVWQETLVRAWAARRTFEWRGTPLFRRWLLQVAQHCIDDQRRHFTAARRRPARGVVFSGVWGGRIDGSSLASSMHGWEPWASTTPSRVATEREKANVMLKVLESLPDEVREVVRLRLIEDLPIGEIATQLSLGESAVRHRFRKGAEIYHLRLREDLRV